MFAFFYNDRDRIKRRPESDVEHGIGWSIN